MDIVSTTEASALKLEYNGEIVNAQNLRKDVLRALKMNKPTKHNLTKEQRSALKEIKKDDTISIYPFDKGTGFVRIKTEDAITKIHEQLGPTDILPRDPTTSIAQTVHTTLAELNKKKRFTKKEYEKIYPSDPIPPRLYGTIKAHKANKNYPMRLVVSTIGTATYGISEYLVDLIQPTLNKNITRLKNSSSFVKEAKQWKISPDEVQVSYDVVNLYPSVPLKEATVIILDMIKEDHQIKEKTKLDIKEIKTLIDLCLSRCYFIWNEVIHELKDSGPIGLSLMVVIAEGFLQYHEQNAINIALRTSPLIQLKTFYRYVDDSHARFPDEKQAEVFQTILNQQHPKIQYTIEKENSEKELNFLDINVKNNKTGSYDFKVHRKSAITNVQVKKTSSHDPHVIKGIFKGFVHRAFNICSEKYVTEELKFLTEMFIENGYEKSYLEAIIEEVKTKSINKSNDDKPYIPTISLPWIPGLSPKLRKIYKKAGYKAVFKSGRNLQQILTAKNKARLPKHSYPGVYKIPCTKHPNNPYIGETKLKIRTRGSQHKANVEKKQIERSAVALHDFDCDGNIEWEKMETLKVESRRFEREVRETLEIQYHECGPDKGGMNIDYGKYVKTKFWTPLFASMRNQQHKR